MKSESGQRTDAAILAEHKKKEREAAKSGKQPFYLSKSNVTFIPVCVFVCVEQSAAILPRSDVGNSSF